jgi:two-component system chemotaxis sensor kinase CheA
MQALQTLVLPRDVSPFERAYLAKTNRLALVFFALHVPAFTLLAWVNGTRPLTALALSSAVLAGPGLAYATLKSPRAVSVVFGVAAMAMGGLLVHFGQGPVQIEMHFYFFALLAMLALFANPMVIVAATVTVALHHLALWFLIPASVFNYEAPLWVVLVHAGFVVLEAAGACYIARSFFDNVIGLETIVRSRTEQLTASQRDMRLVLDHVDHGFVTIDRAGVMATERSAALDAWFGAPTGAATFFELLAARAPAFAASSRFAWDEVVSGLLPLALTLDQMPAQVVVDGRMYHVAYKPIGDAEAPDRFLVVVADVTAARASAAAETERREAMQMLERMAADRTGFLEFFEEAGAMVARVTGGDDDTAQTSRTLHTLKGNAAVFGLSSIATICHDLEGWIEQESTLPPDAQLERLHARWTRLAGDMERLVGSRRRLIEVELQEHAAVEKAIARHKPREELLRMVHRMRLEPAQRRLEAIGEQAVRLAERLDKQIDVTVNAGDLRVDARHWATFWGTFVHAVRNAVDHGIEPADERVRLGKPDRGHVELRASMVGAQVVFEIADDGRGIDWARVAERAASRGLPTENGEDLQSALFADGVSTADTITEVSGRGVGMGALLEATEQLDGRVSVLSEAGRGTTLRFTFDADQLSPDFERLQRPSVAA